MAYKNNLPLKSQGPSFMEEHYARTEVTKTHLESIRTITPLVDIPELKELAVSALTNLVSAFIPTETTNDIS